MTTFCTRAGVASSCRQADSRKRTARRAGGTLRRLAAEIDPRGTPHDLHVLEKLLHYLVRGYRAEHEEV